MTCFKITVSKHILYYCFMCKRKCRFGAGFEINEGKGNTPGFEVQTRPSIDTQDRGFGRKLVFKSARNTVRMVQTATKLLQLWRGNCDVKIMLYDTNPMNPDITTILQVCDYLVSYATKGAETLAIEKKNMKELVMQTEDMSGNKNGVFQIARKLLNRAMVARTIPKQEAMVLLGDLSLTSCSEYIEPVSLSNFYQVDKTNTQKNSSWMKQYRNRNGNEHMSFHDFVKKGLNVDKNGIARTKKVIPHYT